MRLIVSGVTPKNEAMFFKGTASLKSGQRFINFLYRISGLQYRLYKIFCVNGNTGFRNESRIFYFIDLQNEEDYERKESSSAR